MAQERKDLEISRLYLNVAIECFNKAALEEHADGTEVFRRMGRRYISEAELYDATLQQKLAGPLALPQLWRRIDASSRAHGRSIVSRRQLARAGGGSNAAAGAVARPIMLSPEQRRALAMLATGGRNGETQPFLVAHGFGGAMITGLVNRGLSIMTLEKIRAGGKMIEVVKVRITAVGRDVLGAEG
jgi:hypothetical protein